MFYIENGANKPYKRDASIPIVIDFIYIYYNNMKCELGKNYFCQLILLFSLVLLLFMGSTALFDTIHEFHCTISANFYLNLSTLAKSFQFQQNKRISNRHECF